MKKILILIVTQILLMSLIGPATVLAASPIVNGSFETGDYTGWTLSEIPAWPQNGTWGIATAGETIEPGDSVYDYFDTRYVVQGDSGLPITYAPSDGNFMAFQLQNGSQFHRMYQDVTLAGSATTLSLDMFYTNHLGEFNNDQYLAIHIRDLSDNILQTLYKPGFPGFGDNTSILMTNFTFDISAFASEAVRIDVTLNNQSHFFPAGFDNFVIEQGGAPPGADPNGPYTGTVGNPVALDGSGSSDPDGTIVAYDWDFGDSSTGTGETPSHTYAAPGTYTVTLTVTDNDGGTGMATTTAVISGPPGWEKGKKKGWDGDVPPGLDKKDKTPGGFKKGGKNGWE